MFVFENCTGLTLEANKGNSVISDCKTVKKLKAKTIKAKQSKWLTVLFLFAKQKKPKHPGESFYELKA